MKRFLLTLLVMLTVQLSYGQLKLYVWALEGLPMYAQENGQVKEVQMLSFGSELVKQSGPALERMVSTVIDSGMLFQGNFLLVKFENKIGYVNSAYLSRIPTATINTQWWGESYHGDYLDKAFVFEKLDSQMIEYPFGDSTVEIFEHIIYYKKDLIRFESTFDGCFDHAFVFTDHSWKEVYLWMRMFYGSTEELDEKLTYRYPALVESTFDGYVYSGTDATAELRVSFTPNGVKVYSYDCD